MGGWPSAQDCHEQSDSTPDPRFDDSMDNRDHLNMDLSQKHSQILWGTTR
jgi:hypothetical protein